MTNQILILGDTNRHGRVKSVLKVAETFCIEQNYDSLRFIRSIEDHKGDLQIVCFYYTDENNKYYIELIFKQIWELFSEYCITVIIAENPKKSVWVNVYEGFDEGKLYIQSNFYSLESAQNHISKGYNNYIKTIEITNEL